jgi:PAS domain S-box-containing protein
MKVQRLMFKLRSIPPLVVFLLGLGWELALGELDSHAPHGMSFLVLHLISILFVACAAGKAPAVLLSLVATTEILMVERMWMGRVPGNALLLWNACSRFAVFASVGWLAAHTAELTHRLSKLLEERTAQWRETQEALRTQTSILEQILAASPMGISAHKASGECVFVNEALARIVGATVAQVAHDNFHEIKSWKESELYDMARRAIQNGLVQSGEVHVTTRFGKTLWLDIHLAPFTSNGQPHLLFMCYDITSRQRLERQILEISDREQARIGQDIHDGLCQQLVSLAFDANALQRKLAAKELPEAAAAQRIADYLDHAITESRQLARGLFPIRLAAEGLPSALQELAAATAERHRIVCTFHGPAKPPALSKATATHLYRIAREAVTNAIKHSQAQAIAIRLTCDGDSAELRIEDNGIGMSRSAASALSGLGLYIMDYRARGIGGVLRLEPGSPGGTSVSCCVPARTG